MQRLLDLDEWRSRYRSVGCWVHARAAMRNGDSARRTGTTLHHACAENLSSVIINVSFGLAAPHATAARPVG